jgi:hypothetical protein
MKRREKTLVLSFFVRFFFRRESTVKFFHQPRREREKSDVSPFDFSLVDRFDTNNNFNNNNNNNNNNNKKKKKKKKTKEIDNKYTEYS